MAERARAQQAAQQAVQEIVQQAVQQAVAARAARGSAESAGRPSESSSGAAENAEEQELQGGAAADGEQDSAGAETEEDTIGSGASSPSLSVGSRTRKRRLATTARQAPARFRVRQVEVQVQKKAESGQGETAEDEETESWRGWMKRKARELSLKSRERKGKVLVLQFDLLRSLAEHDVEEEEQQEEEMGFERRVICTKLVQALSPMSSSKTPLPFLGMAEPCTILGSSFPAKHALATINGVEATGLSLDQLESLLHLLFQRQHVQLAFAPTWTLAREQEERENNQQQDPDSRLAHLSMTFLEIHAQGQWDRFLETVCIGDRDDIKPIWIALRALANRLPGLDVIFSGNVLNHVELVCYLLCFCVGHALAPYKAFIPQEEHEEFVRSPAMVEDILGRVVGHCVAPNLALSFFAFIRRLSDATGEGMSNFEDGSQLQFCCVAAPHLMDPFDPTMVFTLATAANALVQASKSDVEVWAKANHEIESLFTAEVDGDDVTENALKSHDIDQENKKVVDEKSTLARFVALLNCISKGLNESLIPFYLYEDVVLCRQASNGDQVLFNYGLKRLLLSVWPQPRLKLLGRLCRLCAGFSGVSGAVEDRNVSQDRKVPGDRSALRWIASKIAQGVLMRPQGIDLASRDTASTEIVQDLIKYHHYLFEEQDMPDQSQPTDSGTISPKKRVAARSFQGLHQEMATGLDMRKET